MNRSNEVATHRARWAAIGAALAVAVGGGGLMVARAAESSSGSTYVGITPCRVVDTRPAPDNVGARSTPLGDGETYSTAFVGAVGECDIPAEAVAVVLNLAIVNPTASSFLTVFPAGGKVPRAANVNFVAGQAPASNAATVRIGDGEQVSLFNLRGSVDVTVDVSGYYLPAAAAIAVPSTTLAVPAPSKNQTLNISPRAAGSGVEEFGCTSTTNGKGTVPLQLPSGATIQRMSAVVVEEGGPWSVKVRQRVPSPSGFTTDSFPLTLSGTGKPGGANVTVTAPATPPFTVAATGAYDLVFDLGVPQISLAGPTKAVGAYLCSLSIGYTLP